MLPIEIPPDATIESLVTELVPELHGKLVPADASREALSVSVRVQGRASWTVWIRGPEMSVEEGEIDAPTLWMHVTERAVERFLEDARGPKRMLPRNLPHGGLVSMSDPRVVRRVAMASGRIELALRDDDGEQIAMVFGFGSAARRPIDPDDADVTVEVDMATLDRVLSGSLGPEEALADGAVRLRGNRFLALQLALAVAPFWPARPR
jgi:putative sterol carrier protein